MCNEIPCPFAAEDAPPVYSQGLALVERQFEKNQLQTSLQTVEITRGTCNSQFYQLKGKFANMPHKRGVRVDAVGISGKNLDLIDGKVFSRAKTGY